MLVTCDPSNQTSRPGCDAGIEPSDKADKSSFTFERKASANAFSDAGAGTSFSRDALFTPGSDKTLALDPADPRPMPRSIRFGYKLLASEKSLATLAGLRIDNSTPAAPSRMRCVTSASDGKSK